jgi:hypothetical protein
MRMRSLRRNGRRRVSDNQLGLREKNLSTFFCVGIKDKWSINIFLQKI